MSIQSDVTKAMEWHFYEDKSLVFTVLDAASAAVDLSATALSWKLLRQVGVGGTSTALITKTTSAGIAVSGTSHNIVTVTIASPTDYASVPEPGVYRHELRDTDNDLLLAYGDAWLLSGASES